MKSDFEKFSAIVLDAFNEFRSDFSEFRSELTEFRQEMHEFKIDSTQRLSNIERELVDINVHLDKLEADMACAATPKNSTGSATASVLLKNTSASPNTSPRNDPDNCASFRWLVGAQAHAQIRPARSGRALSVHNLRAKHLAADVFCLGRVYASALSQHAAEPSPRRSSWIGGHGTSP